MLLTSLSSSRQISSLAAAMFTRAIFGNGVQSKCSMGKSLGVACQLGRPKYCVGSNSVSSSARFSTQESNSTYKHLSTLTRPTAVKAAETDSDDIAQTILLSEVLQLPDYCAGCGIKLQAEDADRPG
jgi:hypothetical protein